MTYSNIDSLGKSGSKVAAVVVTYNRKEMVLETIQALLAQSYALDRIFVIDNASADGTGDYLRSNGIFTGNSIRMAGNVLLIHQAVDQNGFSVQLTYIQLPNNTGGAGGFCEGINYALKSDADWIWIMDDDAEPDIKALETLIQYVSMKNVAALAGSVVGENGDIQLWHRGLLRERIFVPLLQTPLAVDGYHNPWIEIDTASFVGLMVNASVARRIDPPPKAFFIHHDDVEYCSRLRRQGKILLVPPSIIIHKDDRGNQAHMKRFLGRTSARIASDKIWLSYFSPRNLIYIGRRHCSNSLLFYLQVIAFCVRQILGILVFDDFKRVRIGCLLRAVKDGLNANFENRYPFYLKQKYRF